jgi:hypothetical protein
VREQLKAMFASLEGKVCDFADLKLWEKFGLPAGTDKTRMDLLNRGVQEGWLLRDQVGRCTLKGR